MIPRKPNIKSIHFIPKNGMTIPPKPKIKRFLFNILSAPNGF